MKNNLYAFPLIAIKLRAAHTSALKDAFYAAKEFCKEHKINAILEFNRVEIELDEFTGFQDFEKEYYSKIESIV